MPHRVKYQAQLASTEVREKILHKFQTALNSQYDPNNPKFMTPLDKAARYERMARLPVLNDEILAHEIHNLLIEYAAKNPDMLPPHALEIIKKLTAEKDSGIYLTELDVTKIPQANLTNVDLVSFRGNNGMRETLDFLTEHIISPLKLIKFTEPEHIGGINSGYFSSQSITNKDLEGVTIETDIKVRRSIHH